MVTLANLITLGSLILWHQYSTHQHLTYWRVPRVESQGRARHPKAYVIPGVHERTITTRSATNLWHQITYTSL